MKRANRERQRKWRQKQAANGMHTVTVMLPSAVKGLIDQKRRETGTTIAHIIETAVVKLLGASPDASDTLIQTESTQAFKNVSAEHLQQLSDDLKAIAERFDQMAGLRSSVTCNQTTVTNDVCDDDKPQSSLPEDPSTTEIYRLVRLLNNMEVSPDEIAFTLNKRKLKTLSGSDQWKAGEVDEVLKQIHQKYGHIDPLFSLSDHA